MNSMDILEKLETLLKSNHCKISFHYDHQDGYWCEVEQIYSIVKVSRVADLKKSTKRESVKESIIAAIEYLQS